MASFIKKYLPIIVVLALIFVSATAYAEGYRVGPGITLARVGNLSLTGLPKGAALFVDQTPRGTASGTGNLTADLVPGNHMIIVSASSSYPWSALVSIDSGKTTAIAPLLVHTPTAVHQLTGDEKTAALAAIASSSIPTEAAPLRLADGCALVSVVNNQIIANATTTANCTPPAYLCIGGTCSSSTILFSPNAPLTTVLPYPGRQDTLIVGIKNMLYAIGLDPETPQFFAPLIEGAAPPATGKLPDGAIVVREGNSVFSLSL